MSGDTTTVDSEMSTSVNSDASLDIDIVRHHDGMQTLRQTVCNPTFPVATSTANLLDTRYSDTETDSEDDLSQIGRSKIVKKEDINSKIRGLTQLVVSVQGSGRWRCWSSPGPGGRGAARLAGGLLADHVSHVCLVPPLQEETNCTASGPVGTGSSQYNSHCELWWWLWRSCNEFNKYLKHQPHLSLPCPDHSMHSLQCMFYCDINTFIYDISGIISLGS